MPIIYRKRSSKSTKPRIAGFSRASRLRCIMVVCPFMIDQPLWGARVHALGVGSKPIPQKKLTADNLAAALREVTCDPSIREKAGALGEKIRAENGIGNAVALIE